MTSPFVRTRDSVLVIEDDEVTQDAIRGALENEGYFVISAYDGARALEFLSRMAPPSLILLDLSMPVLDGWAVLRELSRCPGLSSIPLCVMTGAPNVVGVQRLGIRVLPKPLDPYRLLDVVTAHAHSELS